MFEGTNTITLCKASIMKILEEYYNQQLSTTANKITVKAVDYDCNKGLATFTVAPKEKYTIGETFSGPM